MSNVINVESLDELMDALAKPGKAVVVFSARDWCVPCRQLQPHIEAAADQLEDIRFYDADVDHVEGIKEEFEIMKVPQVWYYEGDGIEGRQIKSVRALQIISEIKRD